MIARIELGAAADEHRAGAFAPIVCRGAGVRNIRRLRRVFTRVFLQLLITAARLRLPIVPSCMLAHRSLWRRAASRLCIGFESRPLRERNEINILRKALRADWHSEAEIHHL